MLTGTVLISKIRHAYLLFASASQLAVGSKYKTRYLTDLYTMKRARAARNNPHTLDFQTSFTLLQLFNAQRYRYDQLTEIM